MDEVLDVINENLEDYKITVEKDYKNNSKLMLISRQLFHVYLNLINNAKEILIEREISEPKIIIEIKENDNEVITNIYDNGGGIEEKNILKVFEPYFSTKYEQNDKGLGLYITKAIVEKQLHGSISVDNGTIYTCFTVTLPKKNVAEKSI